MEHTDQILFIEIIVDLILMGMKEEEVLGMDFLSRLMDIGEADILFFLW